MINFENVKFRKLNIVKTKNNTNLNTSNDNSYRKCQFLGYKVFVDTLYKQMIHDSAVVPLIEHSSQG